MSIAPAIASVPFVDLRRSHAQIGSELADAFARVLDSSAFTLGEEVESFELAFAGYCGASHCVGVASGTAALTIALLSAGVGPGDEVVVPAHTYVATALAVVHAGATPVFCDVDDGTGLVDADSASQAITSRTAAIVPVHLYGQVCDMNAVSSLARRHGLMVIEDVSHAHGARLGTERAGALGDASSFSFFPSKNLGALGDGGAICTDSAEIAERARRLRNLGQHRKGEHAVVGFNERLDALQAAMLLVKLEGLDDSNAARRELAARYSTALPPGCRVLAEGPGDCVYHLFPIRVQGRDQVRSLLEERGIGTGVHYWPAAHLQPPFAGSADADLPTATRWSEEELSLPMFPELTAAEVEHVAAVLGEVVEEVGP